MHCSYAPVSHLSVSLSHLRTVSIIMQYRLAMDVVYQNYQLVCNLQLDWQPVQ